jgi:hypothetical protein
LSRFHTRHIARKRQLDHEHSPQPKPKSRESQRSASWKEFTPSFWVQDGFPKPWISKPLNTSRLRRIVVFSSISTYYPSNFRYGKTTPQLNLKTPYENPHPTNHVLLNSQISRTPPSVLDSPVPDSIYSASQKLGNLGSPCHESLRLKGDRSATG